MKKILIVNNNLDIGGIQKSLVNLLNEISGKYDIDLLLFNNSGALTDSLPKNIRVIDGGFWCKIMGMTYAEAKAKGILYHAARFFWTAVTRAFGIGVAFNAITAMTRLHGRYDAAISFMQNNADKVFYGGCAEFVLNSVKSDLKICFIHCDFANYGGNTAYNRKTLMRFDRIAAVSHSVARRLADAVPELADKIFVVHNCFDFGSIERLGGEYEAQYIPGAANLFSAARLHSEKGILRMMPILGRLKKDGLNFVWRIAGDGPDRAEAERLIAGQDLGGSVVLLGNLVNPYPYFKKSDLVLVPSYNEAAPMVYGEAAFFGTRVFTTDTTSARELIEDKKLGIVCRNDDESIEKALRDAIEKIEHGEMPHCGTVRLDNSLALSEFDCLVQ